MRKNVLQHLYEMYGREIFQYLYVLSGDRETAGELCQETFLKALLSLSESHTNMQAWLYLVARNLYFNAWKQNRRQMPYQEEMADILYNPAHAPDVLDEVVRREENQMLYQALAQLPEQKREIIALQYFGGWRLKKIASFLGLTPENTRVLAHRARQEIRQYMEVNGYDIP